MSTETLLIILMIFLLVSRNNIEFFAPSGSCPKKPQKCPENAEQCKLDPPFRGAPLEVCSCSDLGWDGAKWNLLDPCDPPACLKDLAFYQGDCEATDIDHKLDTDWRRDNFRRGIIKTYGDEEDDRVATEVIAVINNRERDFSEVMESYF